MNDLPYDVKTVKRSELKNESYINPHIFEDEYDRVEAELFNTTDNNRWKILTDRLDELQEIIEDAYNT